jgi:hypothetical protein
MIQLVSIILLCTFVIAVGGFPIQKGSCGRSRQPGCIQQALACATTAQQQQGGEKKRRRHLDSKMFRVLIVA